MTLQGFAKTFGWIYIGAGLLGFFPGIVQAPPPGAPELAASVAYGYLIGLFPINLLHNLVHLGIGGWGLASAGSWTSARTFARGLAWFYGALAIMGLIPVLNTMFGLVPIFGHDIWLHALTAVVAAYYGYGAGSKTAVAVEQWRKAS